MNDTPIEFWSKSDEGAWLSAFEGARMKDSEGRTWASIERWYQAGKADNPRDQERIRQCATSREAKRLGRAVPMRPDWDEKKCLRMAQGVLMRFRTGTQDAERLVDTGDRPLHHTTPWGRNGDTYWGTGRDGTGANRYGRMLEIVRDGLKNGRLPITEDLARAVQ